jgi:hypothetical protein
MKAQIGERLLGFVKIFGSVSRRGCWPPLGVVRCISPAALVETVGSGVTWHDEAGVLMTIQDPGAGANDLVPVEVAGETLMVPRPLAEKILSPEGWGDLTIEELASAGIHPGMNTSGDQQSRAEWRPDEPGSTPPG